MIKFLGKSQLLHIKSFRRFTQRNEIDSIPLSFVGNPKASVLKDFLDYQGEIDHFKQTNQINKENKFQNSQASEMKIKEDLQSLLGQNFERYANSLYKVDVVGASASYNIPSSAYHSKHAWNDRIFKSQAELKVLRQIESQGFRELKSEYPMSAQYPLENLRSIFTPIEFCDGLTERQLIMFNIPLNVNEEDVKLYVQSKTSKEVVKVEIQQCKLNLNSSAVITFQDEEIEETKSVFHLQRFNGCLLDVKSLKDGQDENAWDRTLVLLNLDPSLQLQEVIHHASQYGRVTNFVVPTMIFNPDLPLEDELIEALQKQNLEDPVRLVIYDLENNKIVRQFWPSEEEFMAFNKNIQSYNDLEDSVLDFQEEQYQQEVQQRLFFLKSEREYHCVRVPMHQKDEYRKLWIPNTKKGEQKELTPFQRQLQHLFKKQYVNVGFCLMTYASKLLAQRALYNINLTSSKDLSLLDLKQINQPKFWPDLVAQHSEPERYGHKFRIENLFMGKQNRNMQAIKAWAGMELYQVDYMYIIHQMERIRRNQIGKIEEIRQRINEESIPREIEDQVHHDRKEELRQKVMRELSEPQSSEQFDKMVMRQNFSQHEELFGESVEPMLSSKPGRNFDINVLESDYAEQISRLIQKQQQVQGEQIRYVVDIVKRNQKEYLDKARQVRHDQVPFIEGDEIDQDLQDRMIDRYQKLQISLDSAMEPFDKVNEAATKAGIEFQRASSLVKRQKNRILDAERRVKPAQNQEEEPPAEGAEELNNKSQQKFSTYNKKQAFQSDRQSELKRETFLKDMKKLMFGSFGPQEREELFTNDDQEDMDMMKHNQLYAEDHQSRKYLDQVVIEQIREFDLPEQEHARMLIRQQEFNRRYLVSLVPDEFLKKLRDEGREHLSDSMLSYYRDGFPTESIQLEQEVDGESLKDELNRFVAGSGEKYHYEVDAMTKNKYILKSEKPYFKYDLSAIIDVDQVELSERIMQLLQKDLKMSRDNAQQMVQQSIQSGEIAKPIIQLFDKYKTKMSNQDIDVEKMCREHNMTKKQLDAHLNNDLFNEPHLYYKEIQEQFEIEEIKLKNQEINPDNIVKDSGEKWRLKDKAGQFVVPKYRKI